MPIYRLFGIVVPCTFLILLVGFGMYLIHTVKANTHVLPRIDELNKLFYRTIKLPNDVLHCQHHTKGHIALYDRCGCQNSDKDILHLIDGDASCLLHLLQIQGLQIDLE